MRGGAGLRRIFREDVGEGYGSYSVVLEGGGFRLRGLFISFFVLV